jgi:hypothetical protein
MEDQVKGMDRKIGDYLTASGTETVTVSGSIYCNYKQQGCRLQSKEQ